MSKLVRLAFVPFLLILPLHSASLLKELDGSTVVLSSKEGAVTVGDLQGISSVLDRFEDNLFDFYQKSAEQKLLEKILQKKAKEKKFESLDAYLRDLDSKVKVSEKEVLEYTKKNSSQLKVFDPVQQAQRDMSPEEVASKLKTEKANKARAEHFQALLKAAKVDLKLKRDPISVPVAKQNPVKGPDKAEVTLHAFSDFQCPYCAKTAKELTTLSEKHKKKLKVVFHHLPLSFHALAKPAAIASFCAQEQGKFWQFHDSIFAVPSLKMESFSEVANTLKLNVESFEKCRQRADVSQLIQDDIEKAQKLGIQSTPSFIVGSKRFAGYKSVEELEQLSGLR